MRLSPRFAVWLVIPLLGCAACASPDPSTSKKTSPEQAAVAQATLEEDFDYPGAESYRASGITLKKGDGNLLLVPCTQEHALEVESFASDQNFCFQARGSSAYVTLELADVFLIYANRSGVTATALVNGDKRSVPLNQGYTSFTYGTGANVTYATLLELRVSP